MISLFTLRFKEMIKKTICKLFLLFVVFLCFDFLIGVGFKILRDRSKYGILGRQNYILQKAKEENFILGSSRAAHHYIPAVLLDSTKKQFYNAGSDGMCIYYHYSVLSSLISRQNIKYVIYDITELDLVESTGASFTLSSAVNRLSPYYGEKHLVDSLFYELPTTSRLLYNINTYKYNSHLVQLVAANYINDNLNNGYAPLYGSIEKEKMNIGGRVQDNIFQPDLLKISYLKKLMKICNENKIKLIIFYSPSLSQATPKIINNISDLANEYNVEFYDYSNWDRLEYSDFKDMTHLNDQGAQKYTIEVGKILNNKKR